MLMNKQKEMFETLTPERKAEKYDDKEFYW
jgi:hypothetical protein